MGFFLFCTVLLVHAVTFSSQSPLPTPTRELLQIHMVFKHGHRTPFFLYPTDPNPLDLWPEGLGNLTELGKLQLYSIGKYFKERYRSLLSNDLNEVQLMSAAELRCLESGYSLLAGMYFPDEGWNTGINWQHMSATYLPETQDKYFHPTESCPRYEIAKKRTRKSPEIQAFNTKYKELFDFISNQSGMPIPHFNKAGDLHKTIAVERDMNYTVPQWALSRWDDLEKQSDISYYAKYQTILMQKMAAGPLLGLIVERMRNRTEGKDSRFKVFVYSGHGSNVAAIQCALWMYTKRAPFGGTLMFELYRETDGGATVRLLFFNSSSPEKRIEEPFVYQLRGCGEYCSLRHFENFIQGLEPSEWEKLCANASITEKDIIIPIQHPIFVNENTGVSSAVTLKTANLCLLCLLIFSLIAQKNK